MTPKPTHPPPPRRSLSKRPPPKPPRQEATGPMKFGLSPQGIFITREDARKLLTRLLEDYPMLLVEVKEGGSALRELATVLTWVEEVSEPQRRIQVMKSFFECVRG